MVASAVPPPAGSLDPGQFLIDVQTRRQWVGVTSDVDPAQAVLIGDLLAVQAELAGIIAVAKAYTDQEVETRAPLEHTHTMDDIEGLEEALAAAGTKGVPAGCIMIWSGSIITIPAGFVLCNGQNGTPDLRDKFVMGAGGTRPVGQTGGSFTGSFSTTTNGGHSHGGSTTAIALAEAHMPSHTHGVYDPTHAHGGAVASHNHNYNRPNSTVAVAAPFGGATTTVYASGTGAYNSENVAPALTVYGAGTGIGIYHAGGNAAHGHGIYYDGDHAHSGSVTIVPPFYVLAFIMKLP
jgi:hypothetical protein